MSERHGTYACYKVDGCRCGPCVEEARRYNRVTRKRLALGYRRYVPAEQARTHVQWLRDKHGLTFEAISAASGYSQGQLVELYYGKRKNLHVRNVDRILAVTPRTARNAHHRVPSLGPMRRLRALNALGWTIRDAMRAGGFDDTDRSFHSTEATFCDVRNGVYPTVRRDTADVIERAYAALSMRLPEQITPNRSRARNLARRENWAVPLAWDNIDDPAEQPNHGAVTKVTVMEQVAELVHLGMRDAQEIARSLSLKPDTVQQYLRRLEAAA